MSVKNFARSSVSRRSFLGMGAAAAVGLAASPALALTPSATPTPTLKPRSLALYNVHTGEALATEFWADGQYVPEALSEANYLLRDFRTGDVEPIDPALLELLATMHGMLGARQPFHVISGYRSPKTNAMLRKNSNGVAKKSFHMRGKAIDVFLPDRDLALLRKAAMNMRVGGVGYYPGSGFIHVDTGRVRSW